MEFSCVNAALLVLSLMEIEEHRCSWRASSHGHWQCFHPAVLSQLASGHPTLLAWMWTVDWSGTDGGGDEVQWHGWKFGDQKWKMTSTLLFLQLDVMPTFEMNIQQTCSKNWASTQSCKQLTRPKSRQSYLCAPKTKLYVLCVWFICVAMKRKTVKVPMKLLNELCFLQHSYVFPVKTGSSQQWWTCVTYSRVRWWTHHITLASCCVIVSFSCYIKRS